MKRPSSVFQKKATLDLSSPSQASQCRLDFRCLTYTLVGFGQPSCCFNSLFLHVMTVVSGSPHPSKVLKHRTSKHENAEDSSLGFATVLCFVPPRNSGIEAYCSQWLLILSDCVHNSFFFSC